MLEFAMPIRHFQSADSSSGSNSDFTSRSDLGSDSASEAELIIEPSEDLEGNSRPGLQPASRIATAHHEAGHAVMAATLGRVVTKVTIKPSSHHLTGVRLGECELGKGRTRATKTWLEDEVMILLAGMVAEARLTGHYCPAGAATDLKMVESLICKRAASTAQSKRLQRRLLDKTEHLMHDPVHLEAVGWVAEALLERTTIKGRVVTHFLKQARQRKRNS